MSSPPPGAVRAPIRLAIRTEGDWIVAYIAKPDTMKDATPIATIYRTLCEGDRQAFDAWKEAMTATFNRLIERAVGVQTVGAFEERAPEHERSGRA